MGLALQSLRQLDGGLRCAPRKPTLTDADLRVFPFWDATCQVDDAGHLNVAAAASGLIARWCLRGGRKLRQALIRQLGHRAAGVVDAARLAQRRGNAAELQRHVYQLRGQLERVMAQQARDGRLPVLKD